MLNIKLSDGSIKQCDDGISGFDLAGVISKSLQKNAIAIKIDGNLFDLSCKIAKDCQIEIITPSTEDGLGIIRHDAAHIMAQALAELYGDVQLAIGPVIENGFYYDFFSQHIVSEQDFAEIEAKMQEITKRNLPIERIVMSYEVALKHFASQKYKLQLLKDIPLEEEISVYTQGDFNDLCRGPHAPSTGKTKHYKLLKVAGAYWRGDSNNEMLQRIYGTAWDSEDALNAYLQQIEEAQKRDHRKIGKDMDLFHFQDDAPGAVFWHPNGWHIFTTLTSYMRQKQRECNYLEINTPEVLDKSLWEASGHWEKFGHNMFTVSCGDEKREYAVKPMNCPGGVQVYKSHLRSYRELPLRLAEFGKVHRYEPSGALHGLMRVRAFTQDDAHIFCTPDQLMEECKKICDQMLLIYKKFGFNDIIIKFSDRPEKRIGSDEVWDKAEDALKNAAKEAGLSWSLNKGEGAFYGPKLEFTLTDAIGRHWQVGTLQVDFNLPERLGAYYVAEDGNRHHVVMLHQAIFGSLERFIGILIEHYCGQLPLWISPVQVVVAGITNDVDDYAAYVYSKLISNGVRAIIDLEGQKISYKIRKYMISKTPIMLVIGRSEAKDNMVSVRRFGSDLQHLVSFDDFLASLLEEVKMPL